jgi:hypothetical protein
MLRLRYGASSSQEKTPAARRQTRERVGGEVDSADTLDNYEDPGAKHKITVGTKGGRHQPLVPMS